MIILKRILKEIVYRLRGEYTTEKLLKMGLKVGNNFGRLNGVIIDPSHCWLIEIGNNVTLAPRVHILAHDASTKNFLGYTKIANVIIGNNVFIGAESVVLPGVHIGDNVIVAANSTVTKDVPDGYVVAGMPASKICTIEEFLNKNEQRLKEGRCYDSSYTLRGNITSEKKEKMKRELMNMIGFVE